MKTPIRAKVKCDTAKDAVGEGWLRCVIMSFTCPGEKAVCIITEKGNYYGKIISKSLQFVKLDQSDIAKLDTRLS